MLPPFPPYDRAMAHHWDREWLHYFNTESIYAHITPSSDLTLVDNLAGKNPRETFGTVLTTSKYDPGARLALRIWCPGDMLVGKKVLEVGCGCGFLGKQLGLICEEYLGLDYSHFALTISRGVSPSNCSYFPVSDTDNLVDRKGTFDVMVGREFFIHQNYDNATMLMQVAKFMLKPGGLVCADFYQTNPKIRQGTVYPAKSPLDPKAPSSGFNYTEAEVRDLAAAHGFSVESMEVDPDEQRRFVIFRSQDA